MLYSLRSRLMAAFSILLIVPFTVLVYTLTDRSAKSIQSSVEVSTSQTIEQYASHIDTLLTQVEDTGNQVLGSPIAQEWLAGLRNDELSPGEKLLSKRRMKEFLSSLAINDSNGISIGVFADGAGGIWRQDRSYAEREWYGEYRERGVKWTRSHLDPDQADETLAGRAINGYILPLVQLQSLRTMGVIKVNYPTELLRAPLEKIRFGETGRAFLLDSEGRSVLGENEAEEVDELDEPDESHESYESHESDEAGEAPEADESGLLGDALGEIRGRTADAPAGFFPIRRNGTDYLLFYRHLPEPNWTIVGVVPEDELFVEIRQTRNAMLLISGLLLVVVIVVAFGLSKGITRPLSRMARAMRQVKLGDFDKALKLMPSVKSGHSELGFVTDAFEQMTHRLKYLIETEFETNLRRKNAEYKALLLQINPHFYNNSLEIIGGLAAMKREDLVMDAAEALGQMMRYSLNLNTDRVRVAEEFAYIRDYLFILKLRYDEDLELRIEEEEGAGDALVPKFILQPLVENAVKYSLEKGAAEAASVFIGSSVSDGRLRLTVADNGIGMAPELAADLARDALQKEKDAASILNSAGDRIGLRNVLARCRLNYGEGFRFEIDTEPGRGTSITLNLPWSRS